MLFGPGARKAGGASGGRLRAGAELGGGVLPGHAPGALPHTRTLRCPSPAPPPGAGPPAQP
ncbi:hypothetical protein STXM2123_4409 [Streptomyces sp. F-3]|nr:hypothetical protein STXM2123_4409 [Streptomyces sp. F-3]